MNNKLPWYTSWIVILLANFLFPLSLILLILRGVKDRELNYTAGRTLRGIGTWICISGVLLTLLVYSEEPEIESVIVLLVLFFVPGLLFRSIGKKSIQKGLRFKQYNELIYTKGIRSIHQLASVFHLTPIVVEKELNQMRSRGFLPGARLDQAMLILPGDMVQGVTMTQPVNPIAAPVNPQPTLATPIIPKPPKSFQCSGCGNSVVLEEGQVVECEYCGNKITYS
ncbi:MAG: hypothetical protein JW708_04080 [Vallitaleaceae bacterium]|nr:hypothetical protein [Vallitaleaceae bacterium]